MRNHSKERIESCILTIDDHHVMMAAYGAEAAGIQRSIVAVSLFVIWPQKGYHDQQPFVDRTIAAMSAK